MMHYLSSPLENQLQNFKNTLKFKLIIAYSDFLLEKKMCQLADLSQGCNLFILQHMLTETRFRRTKIINILSLVFIKIKHSFCHQRTWKNLIIHVVLIVYNYTNFVVEITAI